MNIGFLSLPLSGHLYPMTALARKLQARGHKITFFGVPDSQALIGAAKLPFIPYSEQEYPLGSVANTWKPIASLQGLSVMRHAMAEIHPGFLGAAFRHLPAKFKEAAIEALVIDTAYAFGELVALRMHMPFVQVWNVLPFDSSGATPPCLFPWPHSATPQAQARNVEGLQQVGPYFGPAMQVAMAYAGEAGLAIDWSNPGATSSPLAVLAQTPKEFDFPGIPWPPQFHYTGPFYDAEGREPIPFPWEKLDGKPIIYASLGTLVNGLPQLHAAILGAAAQLPDVQIVFSIGANMDPATLGEIPANTLIVPAAPQVGLLKRATLCITHAGLNTVQEALLAGVPMVAIPVGYDQPGVAARIAYHGVGQFITVDDLTVDRLLHHVRQVLNNPGYREKARSFQQIMAGSHGLDTAADLVEQAFSSHSE